MNGTRKKKKAISYDPDHSQDEDRFLIIGLSDYGELLVISHCYRHDETIRIISARKATKKESKYYADYNGGSKYER